MSTKSDIGKQQIIQLVFLLAAILLIAKTAQLQLFNPSYQEQARRTTLFKKVLYPSRGLVFDRNDKLLVVNEAIYDLQVVYNQLNPKMDTSLFCSLLDISKETFINNIEKDFNSPRYRKNLPFTFLSRIDSEKYAAFQEHLFEFPGFYPVVRNIRQYPNSTAAHVLGYIGEVNKTTVDTSDGAYLSGDYIGVSGLEKTYENELKGAKGVSFLLKDNMGREVGVLSEGKMDSTAISGFDIRSTLDLDLQLYGELLMQNKRGSIVAIEPKTGEILTMVSAPSYDPNLLSINKDRGKAFNNLLSDTINKPFLDRSLMAKYPPGSIFKPILSLIALQEGVTFPERSIRCPGYYQYRSFRYGCRDHPRPRDISIALGYSCNTYFFTVVRDIIEKYGFSQPGQGLDLMVSHLNNFGLGRTLGIDHLHENKGFVPGSAFYDNLYKDEYSGWRSTYIMSIGIGQGELELTTLQMANLASILANQGFYRIPHLVKSFNNNESAIPNEYQENISVGINSEHFQPVIDGMEYVVDFGTARLAQVPGIKVCGKTGTSQNPHGEDHSVFFAFAPKENPQIAIAVYVENAGGGSSIAAPIAGLLIEKYLTGEISRKKKWLEDRMLQMAIVQSPS